MLRLARSISLQSASLGESRTRMSLGYPQRLMMLLLLRFFESLSLSPGIFKTIPDLAKFQRRSEQQPLW